MDKYLDAIRRILNPHERAMEPTAGDMGYAVAHVKGVDKAKRQVTGVLSTPKPDRYGEVVLPRAFESTIHQFLANPKFLGAHAWGSDTGRPTSIGKWIDIKITDQAVTGTAQFLDAGDELADAWWRRFEQGAVATFSVGFMVHPKGWEFREVEIDGDKKRVRHFTAASLVEVSAVEIPANPDAMVRQFAGGQILKSELRDADMDYTKLAQAICKEGGLVKEIEKLLTDPLGPVVPLMLDTIEAYRNGGSCGHQHHPPADGRDVNGVAEMLRKIAGQ